MNKKESIRKKNKKQNNKKIILCGTLIIFAVLVFGCAFEIVKDKKDDSKNNMMAGYSTIKFSEMYEVIGSEKNISNIYKNLDGQKVQLSGYMAVQSPLDGSFLYLVNQPYVSCPFCAIGDITKLEIIPVYNADGSKVTYTENGVTIYGTLEVGEKIDDLEYTTQCRIYADSITEITDKNVDKELQTYYQNLSDSGMILDIQQLQMNIEYDTKEEYLIDYGTTKLEMIDGVIKYWKEDINDYVSYIKECPDIVKECEPSRKDLKELNNELIELYNKQIDVLEKFATIILEGQLSNVTDEDKEQLYDRLINLNKENLELYNEFNNWNNKLRE